jgi:predicted transcriptional regulator
MELSFQLKTLEPLKGALDILRLYGEDEDGRLDADHIMTTLDLTERTFSKAIRRLVTKDYVQMDGDMIYRLTDNGRGLVNELREYDAALASGEIQIEEPEVKTIARRMICAVPAVFQAGQPNPIFIGFHPAASSATLDDEVEVAVRLTVINGQINGDNNLVFNLDDGNVTQSVHLYPEAYTQMRLRLEVYQLGEMGDVVEVGGMHIDLPVSHENGTGRMIAYGTDISLTA